MNIRKQKGIALPVALILFVVMMMGALYLARSSGSSAGSIANLSYQRSIARAADVALLTANNWLGNQITTKTALYDNVPGQGYRATFSFAAPILSPQDPLFWTGAVTMTTPYNDVNGLPIQVQYVIHRLCNVTGAPASPNLCIKSPGGMSQAVSGTMINGMAAGSSWDSGGGQTQNPPPVTHYLVTARVVNAAKGTSVINQLVVTMGA